MTDEQAGTRPFGNQVATGTLPSDIEVPIEDDLSEWPRFDIMKFTEVGLVEAGDWVVLFGQLAEAAALRLTWIEVGVSAEPEAAKRKLLRAQKKLWATFQAHYNTMKGSISRKLTALANEVQHMGLRMR